MRTKFFILLAVLGLLFASVSARADLSLALTPDIRPGVGSNEVVFTGLLSNTDLTTNVYLNDIQITFLDAAPNYLSAKTNAFFANVPGILLPGESYSDVIFSVGVSSNIPPGTYSGIVTLAGGTNILDTTALTNQTFQIVITPAALNIAISGTNTLLWWPAAPVGSVLQQNADVTTPNWVTVTNTPSLTNGVDKVLVPASSNQFYRLIYP